MNLIIYPATGQKTMAENISTRILAVGPDYHNHRGGVGAVIESHSRLFKPFNFIATYRSTNKYLIPFFYAKQMLVIFFYLLFHPRIKILHIHGASLGSFYRKYGVFLMAKYLFGKKIVYHIHGGGFHEFYESSGNTTRKYIRHFLSKTDVLICLSQKWKTFFLSNFKPRRLEIVHNFMDLPEKANTISKNGKTIFLFLGKISQEKGVDDLLDVARELHITGYTSFELWLGGNGETDKLQKFITDNNLNDCIKYLGWVSGDKKKEILSQATVYVLPSFAEGMPVSILETMAYGMPVISTVVGGIPELVDAGKSGVLIEPGDRLALKRSMEAFISDKELVAQMGEKSREIIKNGFTTQIAFEKLNAVYESLINNN